MSTLTVEAVSSARSRDGRGLHDVTFSVPDRHVAVLVGAIGSGKTSLLRTIAGLDRIAGGRMLVDGVTVTRTPPHRRGIGLVFQDLALFEDLSVKHATAIVELPRT